MYINQKHLSKYQAQLKQDNYLRISDFLSAAFADSIYKCLTKDINWGLACMINKQGKTFLEHSDISDLSAADQALIQSQNKQPFSFVYNTYMIVTSYLDQREPGHFLYTFLEWLNSIETIDYFRKLSNTNVVKINAQATRYLPGHFLKQHNDENLEEGRTYAYVMGFSKNWNPDWGGILNIVDEKGSIVKSMIPEFNSLSIFKVPQNHFVSYVAPFAESERLAITGWLLAK